MTLIDRLRLQFPQINAGPITTAQRLLVHEAADRIAQLEASLRFYVDAFPAFRSKPVGAPGSIERRAQAVHAAQEDKARALLTAETKGDGT